MIRQSTLIKYKFKFSLSVKMLMLVHIYPTDEPGELPQCQMGNRTVDNMCFMITCTNWY